MLSRVNSLGLRGVEGFPVVVELDLAGGLPAFTTVGLPDHAVKESRERVTAAVRNSGFKFPSRRITVNLAPARPRKEGSHYDLPIALALLSASGQAPGGLWEKEWCFVGELSLDGRVRPVAGVLAMAERARAEGFTTIVVPDENVEEAGASGLRAFPVGDLREAVGLLGGRAPRPRARGGFRSGRAPRRSGRPRPRRRARTGRGQARARDRGRGRPQSPAHRPARHRQVHARAPPARPPAAARRGRGGRGHQGAVRDRPPAQRRTDP